MKTVFSAMFFCFISCVSFCSEITVFKQGYNGIFAIQPSQGKADVMILFPYKAMPFQLRSFGKDTLSMNTAYYAGNRDWYDKACFLNIKTGKIVEFIPNDFGMKNDSVFYSYHINGNIWLIGLAGPDLSAKTIFFDIAKKEIVGRKFE